MNPNTRLSSVYEPTVATERSKAIRAGVEENRLLVKSLSALNSGEGGAHAAGMGGRGGSAERLHSSQTPITRPPVAKRGEEGKRDY